MEILLVQGRWNVGDDVKRLSASCRQPLRFGFADNFKQATYAVSENLSAYLESDSDAEQDGIQSFSHVLKADAEIAPHSAALTAERDARADGGVKFGALVEVTPYPYCGTEIPRQIEGRFA